MTHLETWYFFLLDRVVNNLKSSNNNNGVPPVLHTPFQYRMAHWLFYNPLSSISLNLTDKSTDLSRELARTLCHFQSSEKDTWIYYPPPPPVLLPHTYMSPEEWCRQLFLNFLGWIIGVLLSDSNNNNNSSSCRSWHEWQIGGRSNGPPPPPSDEGGGRRVSYTLTLERGTVWCF